MKVKNIKSWKTIHFEDKVVFQKDLELLTPNQIAMILETEVIPCKSPKGHYLAVR